MGPTNLKLNISCNYEAKMATLSSTKLWTIKGFKKFKYCVENVHAKRKPKGNDKLELIREVFELSNQYLQDEYNMFQVHTWQLISSLIQTMLLISGTYTFKTWKTQTKNLGNTWQWNIIKLEDVDLQRFRKGWELNQEYYKNYKKWQKNFKILSETQFVTNFL